MTNSTILIDSRELARFLGIGRRQATEIIKKVNQELEQQGFLQIKTKPLKAPRHQVMKRLGVEGEKQ